MRAMLKGGHGRDVSRTEWRGERQVRRSKGTEQEEKRWAKSVEVNSSEWGDEDEE